MWCITQWQLCINAQCKGNKVEENALVVYAEAQRSVGEALNGDGKDLTDDAEKKHYRSMEALNGDGIGKALKGKI